MDSSLALLRKYWWSAPLALFIATFVWGLNASYPLLGHDFAYAFPHMIAGTWHFLKQGLVPFRYSPFFCGGLPQYGNPQDFYYSLPQFLSFFLGLWTSAQLSIVAALLLGYAGWFLFGRDIVRLETHWAHVLALIISSSGYFFMHMVVGHLTYHALPLVGLWLWFLLRPTSDHDRWCFLRSTTLVSLVGTYMLYSGGYFAVIVGAAMLVILLIAEAILGGLTPSRITTLTWRLGGAAAMTLLLSISKLVAVWSVMRFLPRTIPFDVFPSQSSAILFVAKMFWAIPQRSALLDPRQNLWGIHEYSMFLSPVVLLGLVCIIALSLRHTAPLPVPRLRMLAGFAVVLSAFFLLLIRGDSLVSVIMMKLPIFSSTRVVVRFLYVPILLLAITGTVGLAQFSRQERYKRIGLPAAIIASILTVLAFIAAYVPVLGTPEVIRDLPYDQISERITANPRITSQPVSAVEILPPTRSSDFLYVLHGTTGETCYEPLLLNTQFAEHLTAGPVQTSQSGALNLRNPSCMQYPDENNCTQGGRITAGDRDNLERFRSGEPVTWHLSLLQIVADWLTLLTLLFAILLLALFPILRRYPLPAWILSVNHPGWQRQRDSRWWKMMSSTYTTLKRYCPFRWIYRWGRALHQRIWTTKERPEHRLTVPILSIVMGALLLCFVTYICIYKVFDRDFWWHITAGKIMWQTHALIATDPFAFARVGKEYISTHEWLAQILMYGMVKLGGFTLIILWRVVTMAICFALLLAIDRKRIWVNVLFAILTANIIQLGFVERPQLFTYVLFCIFLLLCSRALRTGFTWGTIALLTVLQILWVNLHGAACLTGLIIVGACLLQVLFNHYRSVHTAGLSTIAEMKKISVLILLLMLGMLVSPNVSHTFTFISSLLGDQTIAFISEWQPRKFGIYVSQLGLIWLVAIIALLWSKRRWVFAGSLLLLFGYMSRQAFRHEMLFIFVAVAVTYDQLSENEAWHRFLGNLLRRPVVLTILLVLFLLPLTAYTRFHYLAFTQRDELGGFGTFDLARGAEDYVEREKLTGNFFNTYGIGGYLIYRRYPRDKVYIDGRNVDYGLPYMMQTYEAGFIPETWKQIEKQYNFQYAMVDYDVINEENKNPYSGLLDKDPTWALTYLDDWVAVYVKNDDAHRDLIARDRFRVLTPKQLQSDTLWTDVPKEQWPLLIQELTRVRDANKDGVKARLALAAQALAENRLDEAWQDLQAAKAAQPGRPKIYELSAAVALKKQNWKDAADAYDNMLANAGSAYPNINYAFIADVYTLAGRPFSAWYYRWLGGAPSPSRSPLPAASGSILPTPVAPSTINDVQKTEQTPAEKEKAKDLLSELMTGTAEDIQGNNDKGIELASKGQFAEAKDAFLKALMLDPGYPVTLSNLCALELQQKNIKEAKDYCERALERGKDFADAHYNLSLVYLMLKDRTKAVEQMNLAEKNGRDVSALRNVLK